MNIQELSDDLNNIANQIGSIPSAVTVSTSGMTKDLDRLNNNIGVTNLLLIILVILLAINTYVKWKDARKEKKY